MPFWTQRKCNEDKTVIDSLKLSSCLTIITFSHTLKSKYDFLILKYHFIHILLSVLHRFQSSNSRHISLAVIAQLISWGVRSCVTFRIKLVFTGRASRCRVTCLFTRSVFATNLTSGGQLVDKNLTIFHDMVAGTHFTWPLYIIHIFIAYSII